ncbi:hypothetical protein [Pseudothermotoga lettingae]|uniref:hypothetical protein n=2 Tax=Pseudothermotoga TaxID=1643951 RepID=UPI00074B0876|nr:hypothetical protein [Pseudothermotoga lettingae]KUK22024.1 MAG: Uncharacterized protein XD56_0079 [Pseudothermotoga lettingae]
MRIFLICALLTTICFSQTLLLNTYDSSGYLFTDDFKMTFKAEIPKNLKYRGVVKEFYIPPRIDVEYIPLPKTKFFITDSGLTLGTSSTDVIVPEEVFEKLIELFSSSQSISIIIDSYPIEVYADYFILLEEIDQKRLNEFLPHFVKYDPFMVSKPGKYPINVSKSQIDYVLTKYPGFGGAIIPVFTSTPMQKIDWIINGVHVDSPCAVFSTGSHTIEANFQNTHHVFEVKIDEQEWQENVRTAELGSYLPKGYISLSGFHMQKFDFPGTVTFVKIEPCKIELLKTTVLDTTPPQISNSITERGSNLFEINIKTIDKSSYDVQVYIDDQKIELTKGLISLSEGKHVLIVMARDNFGNRSYAVENIFNKKLPPEGIIAEKNEFVTEIGGFWFSSPYLKWWIGKGNSVKVRVNGESYSIEAR